MRENIGIYRGKRIDTGEWGEGYFIGLQSKLTGKDIFLIVDENEVYHKVDPETIGEYTGITDKNGVRIFEGDIVLKRTYQGKKPFPVAYHDGMFHCGWGGGSSTATHGYTLADKQIEVIGNIYDNPELLGGDDHAAD